MINEEGRPLRFAGDPKLISELIARFEAAAEGMTDEKLTTSRAFAVEQCAELGPKIEEAQTAYQTPSQAFYVFDRILNRRKLQL